MDTPLDFTGDKHSKFKKHLKQQLHRIKESSPTNFIHQLSQTSETPRTADTPAKNPWHLSFSESSPEVTLEMHKNISNPNKHNSDGIIPSPVTPEPLRKQLQRHRTKQQTLRNTGKANNNLEHLIRAMKSQLNKKLDTIASQQESIVNAFVIEQLNNNDKVSQEFERLNANIRRNEIENKELAENINALQHQINELRRTNHTLTMELTIATETNIRHTQQMDDLKKENNNLKSKNETYVAQLTNNNTNGATPTTLPKSTILLQPKEGGQDVTRIKQQLVTMNKPTDVTITKLKATQDRVEIRCRNEAQKDTLKSFLTKHENIQRLATIQDKTPNQTTIIFPNINPETTTTAIREEIAHSFDIPLQQITIIERKPSFSNKQKDTLLLQTNRNTAKRLIEQKSIFIGMRPIKCFRYVRLYRCQNCHEFNKHTTQECTSNTICAFCAGRHHERDCKERDPECFNCWAWNQDCKKKGNICDIIDNISHPVNDTRCPIYLHERNHRANRA